MSKFNKIYEYEYHLFGQVRKISYIYLNVCSLAFRFVSDFCPCASFTRMWLSQWHQYQGIYWVWSLKLHFRNGKFKNFVFWGYKASNTLTEKAYCFLSFSLQRHSCNPVLLFDAEVEKYCPDNMLQIKVGSLTVLLIIGNIYWNKWLFCISVQSLLFIKSTAITFFLSSLSFSLSFFSYIANAREGSEAVPGLGHLDWLW